MGISSADSVVEKMHDTKLFFAFATVPLCFGWQLPKHEKEESEEDFPKLPSDKSNSSLYDTAFSLFTYNIKSRATCV